ncbi:Uncharacterized protein Fot_48785 [Forsythia ovata]|uniref:Uncharacterized protein n=1 Tax=Forsythia ovata TaxID=205694 RepID=A0ABD1QDC4_9LAMI
MDLGEDLEGDFVEDLIVDLVEDLKEEMVEYLVVDFLGKRISYVSNSNLLLKAIQIASVVISSSVVSSYLEPESLSTAHQWAVHDKDCFIMDGPSADTSTGGPNKLPTCGQQIRAILNHHVSS